MAQFSHRLVEFGNDDSIVVSYRFLATAEGPAEPPLNVRVLKVGFQLVRSLGIAESGARMNWRRSQRHDHAVIDHE